MIDCGPDCRTQLLRSQNKDIDFLLLTHSHYDHVGGIDDLRPFCGDRPFPIFCKKDVIKDLHERLPYCFKKHPYPGVPSLNLIEIDNKPFRYSDIDIELLEIMHYKLPLMVYKIGNMAYITDAKTISEYTISKIKYIDCLIINALRIN